MREPEFWLRTKTKVWRQSQRNGAHGRIQKMNKSKRISATRGIIISKVTIVVYFLHKPHLKRQCFEIMWWRGAVVPLCWSQAMSWGRIKAIYEEWFQGQRSGGCRKVKKVCPGFRTKVNSNVRMKEFQFYVTFNLEVHPDVLKESLRRGLELWLPTSLSSRSLRTGWLIEIHWLGIFHFY